MSRDVRDYAPASGTAPKCEPSLLLTNGKDNSVRGWSVLRYGVPNISSWSYPAGFPPAHW